MNYDWPWKICCCSFSRLKNVYPCPPTPSTQLTLHTTRLLSLVGSRELTVAADYMCMAKLRLVTSSLALLTVLRLRRRRRELLLPIGHDTFAVDRLSVAPPYVVGPTTYRLIGSSTSVSLSRDRK